MTAMHKLPPTKILQPSFDQIVANNAIVDQAIDDLVNAATNSSRGERQDEVELEKTGQLMFLSLLISGENDGESSCS